MITKFEYKINIKGEFGSKFQKDVALSSLKLVLETWLRFYLGRHKLNNFFLTQVDVSKRKKI